MSNVSNSHNIAKLDKNSKALSGQRIARVIAKKNKAGEYESQNLTESKFVSIPCIGEVSVEQLKAMQPHIVGILMGAQDALIRERIVEAGATSVNDEEISIDQCIKYLDDSAKGNRITGDWLKQWFTETYFESACEFVCVNMKFDPNALSIEQEQVLTTKANVLRDMFAGFASGKYRPENPVCRNIMKFGEFLGAENMDLKMQNYVQKARSIKEQREAEMSSDALFGASEG